MQKMPVSYYSMTEKDVELSASGLSTKEICGIVGAALYIGGFGSIIGGLCNKPYTLKMWHLYDGDKLIMKTMNSDAIEPALLAAEDPTFGCVNEMHGNGALSTCCFVAGIPMAVIGAGLIGAYLALK